MHARRALCLTDGPRIESDAIYSTLPPPTPALRLPPFELDFGVCSDVLARSTHFHLQVCAPSFTQSGHGRPATCASRLLRRSASTRSARAVVSLNEGKGRSSERRLLRSRGKPCLRAPHVRTRRCSAHETHAHLSASDCKTPSPRSRCIPYPPANNPHASRLRPSAGSYARAYECKCTDRDRERRRKAGKIKRVEKGGCRAL
ncbi:hypothetical protein FB451DRAFT_1222917 [Mycena latifolia]|nr:hypothetical protein FB451DRAFT_1222917 [Mycena latifolia]